MTNLRRFYLSSDAAISEHDAPDGTWCRAAEAMVTIEALAEKVADLQAQIATLQIDVADWKAIAEEREKIAAIAVQRYKEASDQLNAAKANNESEATNAKTV
jgi:hypothetical protein